jgi:general secretion pathway protein J
MVKQKQQGFTLLEILIALSVFAVVAVITSSVLYNTFTTRDRLLVVSDKLAEMQIALYIIEKDITQLANRKVNRGDFKISTEVVAKPDYFEFTRAGNSNPEAAEKRSSLVRVAYYLKDNKLIRKSWPRIDSPQKKADEKVILTEVKSLFFYYYNANLARLNNWQVAINKRNELPSAIAVNLDLNELGKIELVYDVPENFKLIKEPKR